MTKQNPATNLWQDLLFALRFFTRLPLPGKTDFSNNLAKSALAFPLAGLIIGIITALAWLAAASLLPLLPAGGIAIVVGLIITGALHEDGLSDCADGLGASTDRKRALEIMRDSRIGAFGATALITTIALRWTSLAALGMTGGALALIISHMVSRSAMLPAIAWSQYARDEGLGKTVSTGISNSTLFLALAITGLLAFAIGWIFALISAMIAMLAAFIFLKWLEKRLGGYTGDGLGAIQQIAEITTMLALCGFWS